MKEHEDTKLVQKCLRGDERAFESLVLKYQKTIFNLAYRMTNDYDQAEDITQSVFIKTFEKLSSFKPKFKFFSWLYRIAINESLNYLNHQRRIEELNEDFTSKEKSPEEIYSEVEMSEKVQDALMNLEPAYRILIILKHFQDCSYREMAYILDIPEKTVKSRLYTARQLLKDILIKKGTMAND